MVKILQQLKEDYSYNPTTGAFTRVGGGVGKGKIGSEAGWITDKGYRSIEICGKGYKCHRLAYLWMMEVWPEYQIDHINNIKDDNRWKNLRLATNSENQQNTKLRSNNTSGFKGVSWHKGHKKWQVRIGHNNKRIHLGYYKSVELAVSSMKLARETLHKGYHNHG